MNLVSSINIARAAVALIKAWAPHQAALEDDSLVYIDTLMNEITARERLTSEDLKAKLKMLVPGMTLSTAQRLIDLKYLNPGKTEILGQRVN